MYRESYQRGMLTIFFSGGSKPLEIWETQTKDGYIKRFLDQEIKTMVLEVRGANISTTFMICPKGQQVLGITMPFLVMVVKNLKKYFSFEVTILDETGTRRRFRVSNFQSTTQILPLCTVMPISLADGWNQIQFNLAEFTRRAYKKQFVEVQKLKINANIRLRRIYFTEKLLPEEELPPEYKLYFPLPSTKGHKKGASDNTNVKNIKAPPQPEDKTEKPPSKTSIHSRKSVEAETAAPKKASLDTLKEAPVEVAESAPPADSPVETAATVIEDDTPAKQPSAEKQPSEEKQQEVSGENEAATAEEPEQPAAEPVPQEDKGPEDAENKEEAAPDG